MDRKELSMPPDETGQAQIRRARLFEAMMRGGTGAFNKEWDRLVDGPRPMPRIDAHDIGDVLSLVYPIPEADAETGYYVLESVLGDEAFLKRVGEDERGDIMATERAIIVNRNLLDWFQFMGVTMG